MADAPQAGTVVALVDEVFAQAADAGASDIHFEPTGGDMLVRFRLDGVLSTVRRLPGALGDNVISRLKVLGGLLTYRNDIPQEGRIALPDRPGAAVLDQRLAVFPTIHGQRAVVRLFYRQENLTELEQLGLPETILDSLRQVAAASGGVLLLTGPAGSGKSTTLAALLGHIVRQSPGKSVVALEDPVERHIEGVTQVQVSQHGAMSYPVALRSLLRQDPQVLMIGEIRDAETARIVIEAGLTGHLLLSTLHSRSPVAALLRLLEMGIEPYQVTSSVWGVVNQRLVRRLCEHCRTGSDAAGECRPAGCPRCMQTGFRGRLLLAEMIRLDGTLREALLAKKDLDELESILAACGHLSMRHSGQRLVRQGLTTREELLQACGPGADAARGGS